MHECTINLARISTHVILSKQQRTSLRLARNKGKTKKNIPICIPSLGPVHLSASMKRNLDVHVPVHLDDIASLLVDHEAPLKAVGVIVPVWCGACVELELGKLQGRKGHLDMKSKSQTCA
jgi:hypothetical protein